jgi:hypothetical protein
VFSRPDPKGRAQFHALRAPEVNDLEDIVFNVQQRFGRWLVRHGLLKREDDREFSNESRELSALEAFAQRSLGLGDLITVKGTPREPDESEASEDRFELRGSQARVSERDGYSLYAGDLIPASDHHARERLLRYCLRPPLSLERLSRGPGGSVVYQVKATRRGKATQRVMRPTQFMARIVALIPPPYHPLLRYFGVFGPHSSWRSSVVPVVAVTDEGAQADSGPDHGSTRGHGNVRRKPTLPVAAAEEAMPSDAAGSPTGPAAAPDQRSPSTGAVPSVPSAGAEQPTALDTTCPPERPASRPRWYFPWAELLKRVHDVDALRCGCGGRLRFTQLVTEPDEARTILQSMGLACEPPPMAKARSPTFDPDPLPPEWD